MHADRCIPPVAALPKETANDRLKRRATIWQSSALVIAVVIHFAVLALWPTLSAGSEKPIPGPMVVLPPPEVDVPDPPQKIPEPAEPVIVDSDVDPQLTIPPLTEAWNRRDLVPPAPAARPQIEEDFVNLMPQMLPPRVLNQAEVEQALARNYPPLLRDAGIGGEVRVLLWLDEAGAIVRAAIDESSGRGALDEAALEVVKVMRLTPAYNRSRPTRVIVSLPVRFVAR